jgi:hypothetical protein
MTQVRFHLPLRLFALVSALLAFGLGGCGGGPKYDPSGGPLPNTPRPIAMKGEDKFFDGKVDALLTVSRGFSRNRKGGKGPRNDDTPDLGDVFSSELNDTNENKDYGAIYAKMAALQVRGSPLPPVILRLELKNQGTAPIEVEILEVNSDLGNFAVKPDTLKLPPGEPTEPEPMNSQLGVTSDEIPVKVRLKYAGKVDSKTIVVKSLFTADGKRVPEVK